MNQARADALAARSHLAAHGWIARTTEAFRHLPPPDAPLWLGELAPRLAGEGEWEVAPIAPSHTDSVDVRRLDAADPAQRRELLARLPLPGDDAAAPFAWAHRVLLREGLHVRVRRAFGDLPAIVRIRRRAGAVEAPLLVIELAPGARCVLVETHEADAQAPALVQNLQVHVHAAAGASLQHLRVALPEGGSQVAHHVHVRLERDSNYEQVLLAAGSAYHLQRSVLDLDGAGASARTGSVLLAAGSALDHQVLAQHTAPHTRSGIDALALAAGAARLVGNAYTSIAAGCDEARTRQRLAGIPTSGQPRVILRPHLEINHDQVQAAHGATWGALPEEALFHARQRGLGAAAAKAMIIEGMAAAVLARAIDDPHLLPACGLDALLAQAVAAHLAADRQEPSHG
jgi:Fe-S cluster assembly protein SufD